MCAYDQSFIDGTRFFNRKCVSDFQLLLLTINSICSFWQWTGIWGVVPPSLRSRKPLDIWSWNFCQMSSSVRRHEIRNFFDITWLVCKLQTKIPKNPIFRNATSRNANFTKFCRIVTIDVRNKPWQFQIDISKIGYLTEQFVKWRQMLVCKIQNGL